MTRPFQRVALLVDWDSAFRISPPRARRRQPNRENERDILTAIEILGGAVAHFLNRLNRTDHYVVSWRFYHGWYAGKTKTKERRQLEKALERYGALKIERVVLSRQFGFSDRLLCGTRRNPVFDTLRPDPYLAGGKIQKMVDTALICDLLHIVRFKEADRIVIIADDDDFLPGLFAAEAWGAKAVLLHRRRQMNRNLDTAGLAYPLESP